MEQVRDEGCSVLANDDTSRNLRHAVIGEWSRYGIGTRRQLFRVEQEYRLRVDAVRNELFRPLPLSVENDHHKGREVSYLVDSLSLLEERPDLAFDVMWKAFDSAISRVSARNITDSLHTFVDSRWASDSIVNELCSFVPFRASSYMYKKLVVGDSSGVTDERATKRLSRLDSCSLELLFCYLRDKFGSVDPASRRDGVRVLAQSLSGRPVSTGGGPSISLNSTERCGLLISGLLYTFRNERIHGGITSPFLSSKANIGTYTVPWYASVVAYYCLILVWLRDDGGVASDFEAEILDSIRKNKSSLLALFGPHWR